MFLSRNQSKLRKCSGNQSLRCSSSPTSMLVCLFTSIRHKIQFWQVQRVKVVPLEGTRTTHRRLPSCLPPLPFTPYPLQFSAFKCFQVLSKNVGASQKKPEGNTMRHFCISVSRTLKNKAMLLLLNTLCDCEKRNVYIEKNYRTSGRNGVWPGVD